MPKQVTDVDRCIGAKVREARREKRMTQDTLGKHLEMSFQQVQKYEKGVNRVSSATLFFIAQILEKPIEWFYGDNLKNVSAPSDPSDQLFVECQELLFQLKETKLLPVARDFLQSAVQNRED